MKLEKLEIDSNKCLQYASLGKMSYKIVISLYFINIKQQLARSIKI